MVNVIGILTFPLICEDLIISPILGSKEVIKSLKKDIILPLSQGAKKSSNIPKKNIEIIKILKEANKIQPLQKKYSTVDDLEESGHGT